MLYRVRGLAEVDLRAFKETLQREVLRRKSPALARKELWAPLLAYNLVRGLLARSAQAAGLLPVQVSFAGAVQGVNAFKAALWSASAEAVEALLERLAGWVQRQRVGDRPNRYEPRAKKRRAKPYPLLNPSRAQARRRLTKNRKPKAKRS